MSGTAHLIGTVRAVGDGADVFEEDGTFYAVCTSLVITEDDQEIVEQSRSDNFPSLASFVASLPSGACFVPLPDAQA
jgi:hypothetical protein